jgi:YidC/Oxa1 family membrane protein insertase
LGDVSFAVEGPAELDLEATSAESRVAFVARTESGLVVRKVFTFVPGRYDIGVQLSVGTAESSTSAAALQAAGEPQRARFSWTQGIASTEPNKKWEDAAFRSFAMVGDELEFKKRISMRRDISRVQGTYSGSVRFAGLQNKYFHIAGMVYHEPGNVAEGQIHLDGNSERGQQTWWIEIPLRSQEAAVGDRAGAVMHLYLGPSDFDILKAYGQGIEKTVDLGRTLTRPLSEAVLAIMEWTYRWIPNYGAVIILISVLIKVLFYPLTRASTRSMKRMQEVQPKLKALQEKYKNNREKLSQETMKLYREEKINPMAGCLPLVIQMPVFFALYDVLTRTIALRQAPFVFWIKDMAQPDALFKLPFSLPILGDGFNVLPILMAAAMYWQSKLTPTSAGGQMAALNSVMPLMMLVFFYNLPSGLVLYWLVNNVLTIYQTWKIHRSAPTAGGAQPA